MPALPEVRRTELGNPLAPSLGTIPALVMVEWNDSCFESDYETVESAWAYLGVRTVGFLLRDDADSVVLASEKVDNENDKRFRHVVSIPRGMVTRLVRLTCP